MLVKVINNDFGIKTLIAGKESITVEGNPEVEVEWLDQRIEEGFTHVQDEWWKLLTGVEIVPIEEYTAEIGSYC